MSLFRNGRGIAIQDIQTVANQRQVQRAMERNVTLYRKMRMLEGMCFKCKSVREKQAVQVGWFLIGWNGWTVAVADWLKFQCFWLAQLWLFLTGWSVDVSHWLDCGCFSRAKILLFLIGSSVAVSHWLVCGYFSLADFSLLLIGSSVAVSHWLKFCCFWLANLWLSHWLVCGCISLAGLWLFLIG